MTASTVRFASTPSGAERFRAPHLIDEPLQMEGVPAFPQAAMSGVFADLFPIPAAQSLDGLRLNIWAPADSTGEQFPVLVWMHGGGFRAGWSGHEVYNGESLAGHGIVVITCGYRLGAEGFLADDRVEDPNLGLLDMVTALEWVQKNVKRYGGDPDRVTIGGDSAGAMSVTALLASPIARGLLTRAICLSGAERYMSSATARAAAEIVSRELGGDLESSTPSSLLAATQGLQSQVRAAAAGDELAELRRLALVLGPSVGTASLPTPPLEAIRAGSSGGIDLLVTTARDEVAGFYRDVPDDLVEGTVLSVARDMLGDEHARREAEQLSAGDGERAGWIRLESMRRFGEPVRELARAHASPGGRVFLSEFRDHNPQLAELGAFHLIDLPHVFGTRHTAQGVRIAGEPAAQIARSPLHEAVVAFIVGGTPVGPEGEWPDYGMTGNLVAHTHSSSTISADEWTEARFAHAS